MGGRFTAGTGLGECAGLAAFDQKQSLLGHVYSLVYSSAF